MQFLFDQTQPVGIRPGLRIGDSLNHESQNLAALFRLFIERQFSQSPAIVVECKYPKPQTKAVVAASIAAPWLRNRRIDFAGPAGGNGDSTHLLAKRTDWRFGFVKFHHATVEILTLWRNALRRRSMAS